MTTREFKNRCINVLADEIGKVSPQKAKGLLIYGPDDYETAALEAMGRLYPKWWDRRGPWPLMIALGAVVGFILCKLIS